MKNNYPFFFYIKYAEKSGFDVDECICAIRHIGSHASFMEIHNWMATTQNNLIQETADKLNKKFYEQGLGVISELETKKAFLKMEGELQKTFETILERRNKQVRLLLLLLSIFFLYTSCP